MAIVVDGCSSRAPAAAEIAVATVQLTLDALERLLNGGGQGTTSVASELGVDFLQSMDEIADFAPRVRSAGGSAKVGAAAEGTILIDEAAALRIEQGTRAVGPLGEAGAPGGAQGFRGGERLAFRQVRCAAGQLEVTALCALRAGAFDRACREFRIDGADACDGGRGIRWTARFQSAR